MIYRCPNCGNVLEYDVKSGLMCCSYCGSVFGVNDAIASEEDAVVFQDAPVTKTENSPVQYVSEDINASIAQGEYSMEQPVVEDLMEMKIYHCTSCGADIMVSDVEVSTFCSFCGLPSIIFDRISQERKPQKILPFKLSKGQALDVIQERFAKNKYISDEVKNISVDKIYGIYIPYWIYNSRMEKDVTVHYYQKSTKEDFEIGLSGKENLSVILDASRNLPDELSARLDPFPLHDFENFKPAYLSGFYAERYDVGSNVREKEAETLIKKLMDYKIYTDYCMKQSLKKSQLPMSSLKYDWEDESYKLNNVQYALVPIYFVTIRQNNRKMLVLVNGSTGKIVTNVPIDDEKVKKKAIVNSVLASVVACIFSVILCAFAFTYKGFWILMVPLIVGMIMIIINCLKAKALYKQSGYDVRAARESMMSRERGGY